MTNEERPIDGDPRGVAAEDTFGPAQPGMRRGTVASYDANAGLGIVEDGGQQRWMFHCTSIADGSRSIDVGVVVTFDVRPGGPGRFEAFEVLTLSEP